MSITPESSHREQEWADFAHEVQAHVRNYTVPQYGDYPDDQLTAFTNEDIANNMRRYINRIGRNARGHTEAMRDMFKVAHYAAVMHSRLGKERGNAEV